jgi:hypothetical protein
MEVAGERLGPGIVLSAQDYQNCLCEFHKYWKARTGLGRPKQNYYRKAVGLTSSVTAR